MRVLIALLVSLLVSACATVPITGRQQLSLLSDSEMSSLGAKEYRKVLKSNDVIKGTAQARMVQTVGANIKTAVERYFKEKGQAELLKGYHWEFNLIDSDERNAFCLPGGKVAIYSGILDVTRTEAGLAVVMGHEVAHAIANHGNERMSQSLMVGIAGAAIGAAISDENPAAQAAFSAAFGIGAQLGVLLPFSRLHESEADHLGLIFMAMAGYDPREAAQFWRRMAAASGKGGGSSLEFLSTHPSDQTRIADLERETAEALTYYRGGGSKQTEASPDTRHQPAYSTAKSGRGGGVGAAKRPSAQGGKSRRVEAEAEAEAEEEDDDDDE